MALRDYGINENFAPARPHCWSFMQEFASGDVRIPADGSAEGPDELIRLVRDFRVANRIPMGDVEREIAVHIKKVSPESDRFRGKFSVDHINPPKPPEKTEPLIQQIGTWLYDVGRKEPKTIGAIEIKERAAICKDCRHNVRWRTSCEPCNKEVEARGRGVRARSSHEEADQLRACRIHGLHLPTAVFLDRDYLPRRDQKAPETCWLPKQA